MAGLSVGPHKSKKTSCMIKTSEVLDDSYTACVIQLQVPKTTMFSLNLITSLNSNELVNNLMGQATSKTY